MSSAGPRLLRVAARARAEYGRQAVDPLQAAVGADIFDTPPLTDDAGGQEHRKRRGTREFVEPIQWQSQAEEVSAR